MHFSLTLNRSRDLMQSFHAWLLDGKCRWQQQLEALVWINIKKVFLISIFRSSYCSLVESCQRKNWNTTTEPHKWAYYLWYFMISPLFVTHCNTIAWTLLDLFTMKVKFKLNLFKTFYFHKKFNYNLFFGWWLLFWLVLHLWLLTTLILLENKDP